MTQDDRILKKGVTVWFTGLSGSGKSTLARALAKKAEGLKVKSELLDGDVIRTNLSKGLSFSKEDRDINVKRIGFVCQLLTKYDVLVIVSAISPYREARESCRKTIGDFIEVYVKASVEACEKRDVKGLYKKARAGEIKQFTGVDDPYEEPHNAEVICDTENESEEESLEKVIQKLKEFGYLTSGQTALEN